MTSRVVYDVKSGVVYDVKSGVEHAFLASVGVQQTGIELIVTSTLQSNAGQKMAAV